MAKREKKVLEKKNWINSFTLIGKAQVNDYTFTIDKTNDKGTWTYNQIGLNVNCGSTCGNVRCELMDGFSPIRDNVIYVHGKDADGKDDYKNNYTIDFDDRFDESILEDIGNNCFLIADLGNGEQKFLKGYDFINYLHENLENDTPIIVRGQIEYQYYDGKVTMKKNIQSIKHIDADESRYNAAFRQTVFLDNGSLDMKSYDKERKTFPVKARVIDRKLKEFNGWDLTNDGEFKSGQYVPFSYDFELAVDLSSDDKKEKFKKIYKMVFSAKKETVTIATFNGQFIESGAVVMATEDDLTEELKDLIDMGMYTLEEALKLCAVNGSKERRSIFIQPFVKKPTEEGQTPTLQVFKDEYMEEDFDLFFLTKKEEDDYEDIELPEDIETSNDSDAEEDDLASLLEGMLD